MAIGVIEDTILSSHVRLLHARRLTRKDEIVHCAVINSANISEYIRVDIELLGIFGLCNEVTIFFYLQEDSNIGICRCHNDQQGRLVIVKCQQRSCTLGEQPR